MLRTISDRLFMLGLATLALAGAAAAQTQPKVAVINLQQAVLDTDDIKAASASLEAKYKPRQAELQKLQSDLEGIQQKLQAGQGKLTPQAEGDLNFQGQRIQRELQRKGQDLQEEFDAERNVVLGNAGRRMQAVVQKLAEAREFDVVIEGGSTIYVRPAIDITKEATAEYNKTAGAPAPAAAAPAKK